MQIKNLDGRILHTLPRATLRGSGLRGLDLTRADLSGRDLTGADLSEANLCGADLWLAQLRDVDLSGTLLHGANLASTEAIDGGCLATGERVVAVPHGNPDDPETYIVYAQRIGAPLAETRKYAAGNPELCARLDLIEAVVKVRAAPPTHLQTVADFRVGLED